MGREAAAEERATGAERRLVPFTVDADGADAIGDEPVWHDGKVVGWITSGGYAHTAGPSGALGYVSAAPGAAHPGLEIEIRGPRRHAGPLAGPPFHPQGPRLRARTPRLFPR